MSFANPWALAGLSSLILLLLLSFLRVRPHRIEVSSLVLWKRLRDRNPPIRQVRKPRFSMALLLQMLVVTSGTLALAQPAFDQLRPRPRHLVLVVDTSSRMNTRHSDGRTSFQIARERLGEWIGKADEIDLLWLDPSPQRFTGTPPQVSARLNAMEPALARVRLDRLEPYVEQIRRPESRVLVVSDHEVSIQGAKLLVGESSTDNAGIVAFSIEGTRLFALVQNEGRARPVTFSVNGRRFERPLPHGVSTLMEPIDAAPQIELKIETPDNLSDDNVAVAARVPWARELIVGIWGREPTQLIRACRAVPGLAVQRAPSKADVAIFYQVDASLTGDQFTVLLAPRSERPGFTLGPEQPVDTVDLGDDPLMAHVDRREITLTRAQEVRLPGSSPLILSAKRPIAVRKDKLVVFGSDPFACEWQYFPSFAIFWANLLGRARADAGAATAYMILPVNEPVPLGILDVRSSIAVALDGRKVLNASRAGTYSVSIDSRDLLLRTSLLDSAQTQNAGTWADPAIAWDAEASLVADPIRFDGGLVLLTLALAMLAFLQPLLARRETP